MADDVKYSRQVYVVGADGQRSVSEASVFVWWRGGAVGAEVAKNVLLTGVKRLVLGGPRPESGECRRTGNFLWPEEVDDGDVAATRRSLVRLNPDADVDVVHFRSLEQRLDFLSTFQVVVLTEASLPLQCTVDEFCRTRDPPVKFISCDVIGVVCSLFCDFGRRHLASDVDSEEPEAEAQFLGVAGTPSGTRVTLFDAGEEAAPGGAGRLKPMPGDVVVLRDVRGAGAEAEADLEGAEFRVATCDGSQLDAPERLFAPGVTLAAARGRCVLRKPSVELAFESLSKQLVAPTLHDQECRELHVAMLSLQRFRDDTGSFPRLPEEGAAFLGTVDDVASRLGAHCDPQVALRVAAAAATSLPCLAAFVGGVAAQEVLKAVTCRFRPVVQWFHFGAIDLAPDPEAADEPPPAARLRSLGILLVGAGAVGCEMLKNAAALGIGRVTVADDDVIERSNLARQLLFGHDAVGRSKCAEAAEQVRRMNPRMTVTPLPLRVSPETGSKLDFEGHDLVVGAVDSVEARRYLDGVCVAHRRPYIDCGTSGSKGHVQVVLPGRTETYAAHADPPAAADAPYCVVKAFPSVPDHAVHWARDRFERVFGGRQGPWAECVAAARRLFERYFVHDARHLLDRYPRHFWQPPRRRPTPLTYDPANCLHVRFVELTALLLADADRHQEDRQVSLHTLVARVELPVYVPKRSRADAPQPGGAPTRPLLFRKDEPSHVGWVCACANLRAEMFALPGVSYERARQVAGRIMPAIVTTTAAVAGLAALELLRWAAGARRQRHRNTFVNLALPLVVASEPAPPVVERIGSTDVTAWDVWEVRGHAAFTLAQLRSALQVQFGVEVTMVLEGTRIVYLQGMPGHEQRLDLRMSELVVATGSVDLRLTVRTSEGHEVAAPVVRYSG